MQTLLFFFLSTNLVWPGGQYVDPARRFALNIPAGYRVLTGAEKPGHSYIPVCYADSTVCFQYPESGYPGTNFGAASLAVTVLPARTRKTCLDTSTSRKSGEAPAPSQIDRASPAEQIDGVRFVHTQDGDAAMNHNVEFNRYWGFDRGNCFEISLAITYTNIGVYAPGQVKDFTKTGKAELASQLNTMARSFHALH